MASIAQDPAGNAPRRKRESPSLGKGSYEFDCIDEHPWAHLLSGVSRFSWVTAQALFLDTVVAVEPRVLTSLAGAPFTWYMKQTEPSSPAIDHHDLVHRLREAKDIPEDWGEAFLALRPLLLNWAQEWQLLAPWCIGHALETLSNWADHKHVFDNSPQELQDYYLVAFQRGYFGFMFQGEWCHPPYVPIDPFSIEPPRIEATLPGWNPFETKESEAESRFMAAAHELWVSHSTQQKHNAETWGAVPVPTKRTMEHFTWLAQWLVGRKTTGEIADSVGRHDNSAIKSAITALAREIRLDLPSRRGRPRKKVR